MELTKRYTDFTELTAPMINEFVSKIIIGKEKRGNPQTAGAREVKNSNIGIERKDYGRNVVVFFRTVITVLNILSILSISIYI